MLKLLETLRLYADLLRDVAEALSHPESSPAGAELAAAGCGPLRVRIASPAAAAQRAEGEREVLICGESSRGGKVVGKLLGTFTNDVCSQGGGGLANF